MLRTTLSSAGLMVSTGACLYRPAGAVVASLVLLAANAPAARPAHAYAYAPNCVNVLLRDSYWGQYRAVVQSSGNAAGIGLAFARHGFVVNATPTVGAIMVWPGGAYGASSAGHVAIVTAIHGDGAVLVRHENWPYGSGERPQVFAVRPGHQFVHPALVGPAPLDDAAAGQDT